VHVYSSGDEAELFVNNKSMGKTRKGIYEYRFRWDSVIYEPGEVKVITYKNGKQWATDIVKTAGKAATLQLVPDRNTITADGNDLCFITLRVVDSGGTLVPEANHQVRFSIAGPGEIVATDNGDPSDLIAFPSKERNAFSGLALVIIRSVRNKPGTIKVNAVTDGLPAIEVTLTSK
jgi:beta-galactosidase